MTTQDPDATRRVSPARPLARGGPLERPFESIYRGNLWNGIETRSGPGSGTAATSAISAAILQLVGDLEIETVVDAACGEGLWQPDLPGYLGLDVAPSAIQAARRNHPDRDYEVADVRLGCPTADLVICRDAIQHLSLEDGLALLGAIRRSGSTWLLASTYVGGSNVDVAAGEWYSPDLTAHPFSLPAPMKLIPDGYDYADPAVTRDPAKHLGLWWLR
jgi:hypothetical protein